MADASTTATILGATSIVCGTVLAPLINAHIAKDRHDRESLLALLDESCNALTALSRTWPQAQFAIVSVEGETFIDRRLHDRIYAALDTFATSLWDARAAQVRLRVRLPDHHAFVVAYTTALARFEAIERYVDAFREQGGAHPQWDRLGPDADEAWREFSANLLPGVFRRATHLYEDS